jgi:hypothetical protein
MVQAFVPSVTRSLRCRNLLNTNLRYRHTLAPAHLRLAGHGGRPPGAQGGRDVKRIRIGMLLAGLAAGVMSVTAQATDDLTD